ncbi:PQQ-dependent sugar dehydrogenase [Akkermansiaceae bacterium]|nr:PQQ-dependent sugar dehydrogenase [Akkermansiaceae bacterium]MDB4383933.1 PQQ-dependent sugar dehydrogenase [Akkermansiaceae bacterium]
MKTLAAFLLTASFLLAAPEIEITQTFKNQKIKLPVALAIPPDGTDRLFLVQQFGKIIILPKDRDSDKEITFLDVTDRPLIKQQFEEGLLGLAFHPDYARNRKFYIYYSLQDPKHTRVSEMQTFADDPNKADLSTERVLLEIPQPFWNHNSGNILFGPDGYLYIAIGDGGKSNDPQRFSQNTFVYNGKILRIDVNKRAGNRPYGLPEDNPFLDKPGHHPEIFALGLRNPWGLTFHPDTNQLWAADVGQNAWEEINIITKGGNYGWSFNEATHPANARTDKPSKDVQFIAPIHEYGREDGISITGGIHYRGAAVPQLQGKYIYGDWGFGTIWALETKDGKKTENTVIFKRPEASKFRPTAFVEDADGELLILSHDHKIYTISPKK